MFTTLDKIVKQVMNERGESTPHLYLRYLQFGFDCVREELSILLPHYIVTKLIDVNPNNTIDLPKDYVAYIKIGFMDGDKLRAFTLNDELIYPTKTDDCGNPVKWPSNPTIPIEPSSEVCFYNYLYNGVWGTLYGEVTSNPNGEYKIWANNNQIVFSNSMTASQIFLEYKSNGLKSKGQELVPLEAAPVVRAYIHWMSAENKRNVPMAEKVRKEQLFIKSKREMRRKVFKFTEQEFLDVIRSPYAFTQTVKY